MNRTAASSTFATRALVLRTRHLAEKDRMLTLLSPEHGKLSAVAKGARQTKSKLAAVAQPFVIARFLLAHGRNFAIVTQTEIEENHPHVIGDVTRTAWATYLCELCDSLPEALPDEELFATVVIAMGALNAPDATPWSLEIAVRWFEARFLDILGCAPTIGQCVACGNKITVAGDEVGRTIAFSPASGGTLCDRCAGQESPYSHLAVDALRWLSRLQRSAAPPPPDRLKLTTRARNDLRDALRASIALQLDIRLKSLAFLDELTVLQDLSKK